MPYPLVSMITPSYNQAAYLEAAIQSVFAQEYPNLEYIVVDGGSTDGSVAVIEKYESQLSWWVSEPDHGQADAINKGFRQARGEVVAWLNSDDLLLPGAICEAVQALEHKPELGMVYGDAITFDPDGKVLNRFEFGYWGLAELMRFRIICQPAVFMRRSALEEAGYLDETFHFMLDHQLWLQIASTSEVQHVPQVWAAARHHPEAKNVSSAPKFSEETYRVLNWMENAPELCAHYQMDARRIQGGAHRLAARYYLDGGQSWKALSTYFKALFLWPSYTIQHWHRIAYAMVSLVGLDRFLNVDRLSNRKPPVLDEARLLGWPGLDLHKKARPKSED